MTTPTIVKPTAEIIHASPIGLASLGAMTCYDSFEKRDSYMINSNGEFNDFSLYENHNDLLEKLVWANHHESIIEHVNITFRLDKVSRGVLQEFSRHRLQAISVKSSRYTMGKILIAFLLTQVFGTKDSENTIKFENVICRLNSKDTLFVFETGNDIKREAIAIYDKLIVMNVSSEDILSKAQVKWLYEKMSVVDTMHEDDIIAGIEYLGTLTGKRNVGDSFKHIVTDNWATTIISTMNLRTLKNFLKLRTSGAAWIQIQALANEMKDAIPSEYLRLIIKPKKL